VLGSSQHAYATSKGGVLGLTRALALSYAPDRVRANVIVPGIIRTPMVDFILADESLTRRYVDGTPIGRIGEPGDVAELAVYLGSDESGFVTGAAITIDGGLTLQ
jgi:NAD(P)-dependent dehydrogenase (short-subunit alcohol dehydrogenase family)